MSQWIERILSRFTVDLARLWVACDPDDVLLDESILTELRNRGFGLIRYEDPFVFRAEFEERYRCAWDRGAAGPTPSLIVHWRAPDASELPWDIAHYGRVVSVALPQLFPRLAYSVVKQVEPEYLAALLDAHDAELQSVRGENESKDFILERVYQLSPRTGIRTESDFWREVLRMHFANRTLPELFAQHAAGIIQARNLYTNYPVAIWLSSRSALLRVVQDGWHRYMSDLALDVPYKVNQVQLGWSAKIAIPFEHSDVQTIVDSMFLNGSLQPISVSIVAANMPNWIKAGVVQDPAARIEFLEKCIAKLLEGIPTAGDPHKAWSEFAKQYSEMLARVHEMGNAQKYATEAGTMATIYQQLRLLQANSDQHLKAWVAAEHYADLSTLSLRDGPIMVHRIPDYLSSRRKVFGAEKLALLVFDGLALDQWVQIREWLVARTTQFTFDEGTTFAWLPTVTSVSRQAIFSGRKPSEFGESIGHTNKEESLWKAFWHEHGVRANEIMYQRSLRQVEQLDALETVLQDGRLKVVGLVIDEVDDRLHKERSKQDVALWIAKWLNTGFVTRLFAMLLDKGFHIYLTADHGNVDAVGAGRPKEGDIPETRGERVRVYHSETLLADSAAACPNTFRVNIAALPANFMPLFASGRTAFVTDGEQVVVHGGISVEELIVPFVRVKSGIGNQ
jgi:PglZ domain